MNRRRQRAFTIVELLVVMAIVALLLAIALPALSAARSAGRRTVCKSHLRQIGLALASYHSLHGVLPPAVVWQPPGEPLGAGLLPIGVIDRVARYAELDHDTLYSNWLVLILPHLDRGIDGAQGDPRVPISDERNAALRLSRVPVLLCPEDAWNQEGNAYHRGLDAGLASNRYARGNYAINLGADGNCIDGMPAADGSPCEHGFKVDTTDLVHRNAQVWGSGIAGVNRSFGLRAVADGTSTTVAVAEIRSGLHPADPRGAWALGQIGASIVARHGLYADLGGPNPTGADAVIGCWTLKFLLGSAFPESRGMPCRKEIGEEEFNLKAGSRSLHAGGVHVLMCDGSAHFITDAIDAEIWHKLQTRNGNEVVDWQPQ